MQNAIAIVTIMLLTSVVGFSSYAFWRWIEGRFLTPVWEEIDAFYFSLALIFTGPGLFLLTEYPAFLIVILSYGVGAWLHLRSGGASRNFFEALVIMVANAVGCCIASAIAFVLLDLMISIPMQPFQVGRFTVEEGTFIGFGACFYPVFAPAALLIWRSLRPRQGVEVPLQKEPVA